MLGTRCKGAKIVFKTTDGLLMDEGRLFMGGVVGAPDWRLETPLLMLLAVEVILSEGVVGCSDWRLESPLWILLVVEMVLIGDIVRSSD